MYISKKQSWHIEPPWGLLNDPNGLIWYKGNYHVFFQWNRFAKDHSNKAWGWCVSSDFVHWQFRGSALLPDQPYDAQGVYSGSAMEINGRLCLYYTGNVKQNGCRTSSQCLAISEDGLHFQKQGPLITTPSGYTEHVRDPKVIAAPNGGYWMVLGAQQRNGFGAVLLYTSMDGFQWAPYGTVGLSQEYQMIECPDLFVLGEKKVLLYCPQHRDNATDSALNSFSAYKVLDDQPDAMPQQTDLDIDWQRLDEGFDFYAPQTFLTPDGRRVLLGWMSRMEGEEETAFAEKEPRVHCLTMPRELLLQGNRLCQRPVKELRQLSGTLVPANKTQVNESFYHLTTRAFRFTLENLDFCEHLCLTLHDGEWRFEYDVSSHQAQVCRRRWIDSGEDLRSIFLPELTGLELWCDQSSVELFLNNGEFVFSARICHTAAHPSLRAVGISGEISAQLMLLPENLYQYLPKEEETP